MFKLSLLFFLVSADAMRSSNSCKFLSFISLFLAVNVLENKLWRNATFTRKNPETIKKGNTFCEERSANTSDQSVGGAPREASGKDWMEMCFDTPHHWWESNISSPHVMKHPHHRRSSAPQTRACQTEMLSRAISLFKGPVADVALLPEYPSQSHHSSYTESEEEHIQSCTNLQIQTFTRPIISSLKGKVQPNMSLFG